MPTSFVARVRPSLAVGEPVIAAKGVLVRGFGLGGIFVRGKDIVVNAKFFLGTCLKVDLQ